MEDENEVLDWGNEDDEQQHELHRKANMPDLEGQHGSGDVDDAEDSVSLGEDEDGPEYYAYQQENPNDTALSKDDRTGKDREPSPTRKSASHDGIQQQQPQPSQQFQRESSSTPSTGSPRRNQTSTTQPSPQRSRPSSTTRITHALPPKPVATNVPFLHPSHPSIVEATAMSTRPTVRSESSKVTGSSATTVSTVGTGSGKSVSVDSDLPPGWEVRRPRSGSGVYFYNMQTRQSTWTRPVSSSNSSPLLSHSRSNGDNNLAVGTMLLIPPSSDPPQSQESLRPTRRIHQPPDLGATDSQQLASASATELSYEDRHYRPGGADNNGSSIDNRRSDRGRDDVLDPRFNPHPELAFTPPPSPRARDRPRSLSPVSLANSGNARGRDSRSSRGTRSGRGGRNANTDVDSSMQRDRDTLQNTSVTPQNQWNQALSNPLNTYSNNHQGSRRQQRQQIANSYEPPAYEGRPSLTRNGSTRGRNRDRDHSYVMEIHEPSRSQNMSAPRTRSPPSHVRDIEQKYDSPREGEQPQPANVVLPLSTPAIPPQPQRKRDRPTRFDRPSISTSPLLTSSVTPTTTVQVQIPHMRSLEDDPYVPDDIIEDSRHNKETVPHELTTSVSQPTASAGGDDAPLPSLHPMPRTDDLDHAQSFPEQRRSSPTSETQASRLGPKRAPLPPQSARFREMASRSMSASLSTDRAGYRQGPTRPPPSSPGPTPRQLSPGHRDQQRLKTNSSVDYPPPGPRYQSYTRGEAEPQRTWHAGPTAGNSIGEMRQRDDRRLAATAYPQPLAQPETPMETDINDFSPRISPPPSSKNLNEGPAQSTLGMYGEREVVSTDPPPRGPRAMTGPQQNISTSPTTPAAYTARASRNAERSPPPHARGHIRDERGEFYDFRRQNDSRWKDDHDISGGYQGRREPRGRPNDFPRPISSALLSGPNSTPIGMGVGGPGELLHNSRASNPRSSVGMDRMTTRPPRNMRGRGGALLPHRGSYERPQPPGEDIRAGNYPRRRSESSGSYRQRAITPPLEKKQALVVNTNVIRDPALPSGGNQPNRFEPNSVPDMARTWTPRGVSPPRNFLPRTNLNTENDDRVTPPPSSREPSWVSPTWQASDKGRPIDHYPDDIRTYGGPAARDARPRPQIEDPPAHRRDSYVSESRRNDTLEGRLGNRYDERFGEVARQPHALPPNPTLHHVHDKPYSPEHRHPPSDHHSLRPGFGPEWTNAVRDISQSNRLEDPRNHRIYGDQPPSNPHAMSRRLPSDPTHQDDRMDTDDLPPSYVHSKEDGPSYIHRPEVSRRGGSLLDRLSLDHSRDTWDNMHPQSLQERVQIPSKRDRDMRDNRYPMDSSFDGDDGESGDPAFKKVRRRTGKMRKPRRGGP